MNTTLASNSTWATWARASVGKGLSHLDAGATFVGSTILRAAGFLDEDDAVDRWALGALADRGQQAGPRDPRPGPWTFLFQSPYGPTLLVMALALNRIQAVVPPRFVAVHGARNGRPLSRTLRVTTRIPSLLLLARSVVLLLCVWSIQRGWTWPGLEGDAGVAVKLLRAGLRLLEWLTVWAGRGWLGAIKEGRFDDRIIMLECFKAATFGVATESFMRALDDDLQNQSSFNLISFSFLLHVHSTPKSAALQASTHIYAYLLLLQAELFTLHLSFTLSPPLPSIRLLITAFFSLAGQVAVVKGFMEFARFASTTYDGTAGEPREAEWDLVWMNRTPEMGFELLALSTIGLRWLAAWLRSEPITKEELFGHPTHWPKLSDDYTVALLRYSSSCLESSRLSGLSNEVDPVVLARLPVLTLYPPKTNELIQVAEFGRTGNSEGGQIVLRERDGGPSASERERRAKPGKRADGLGNEVEVLQPLSDSYGMGVGQGVKDPMGRDPDRLWGNIRFYKALLRVIIEALKWVRDGALGAWRKGLRKTGLRRDDGRLTDEWTVSQRGDDDEDDVDYTPSESESSDGEDNGDSEEDDEGEDASVEGDEDLDPSRLYADLSSPARSFRRERSSTPLASTSALVSRRSPAPRYPAEDGEDVDERRTTIFLAHHLAPAGTPVTRRRFRALVPQPQQQEDGAWTTAIQLRREEVERNGLGASAHREWDEDDPRRRMCVVCTAEERTIVLLPCRCLAMCEDCRENLAGRTPASSHLCPTCRSPIKGFSRIYIP